MSIYPRVVLRNLLITRTDQLKEKLKGFISMHHGKKYKLDFLSKSKPHEQLKTFFCSQLVAACYIALGILPSDVSSNRYWPGSFSSGKNLRLIDSSLDQEILLDFDTSN